VLTRSCHDDARRAPSRAAAAYVHTSYSGVLCEAESSQSDKEMAKCSLAAKKVMRPCRPWRTIARSCSHDDGATPHKNSHNGRPLNGLELWPTLATVTLAKFGMRCEVWKERSSASGMVCETPSQATSDCGGLTQDHGQGCLEAWRMPDNLGKSSCAASGAAAGYLKKLAKIWHGQVSERRVRVFVSCATNSANRPNIWPRSRLRPLRRLTYSC